jgi:hypothetical protein
VVIVRAEELVLPSTQQKFVQRIRSMTGWDPLDNDDTVRISGSQNVGRSSSGEHFDPQAYFTTNALFHPIDSRDDDDEEHRDLVHTIQSHPHFDRHMERAFGYHHV